MSIRVRAIDDRKIQLSVIIIGSSAFFLCFCGPPRSLCLRGESFSWRQACTVELAAGALSSLVIPNAVPNVAVVPALPRGQNSTMAKVAYFTQAAVNTTVATNRSEMKGETCVPGQWLFDGGNTLIMTEARGGPAKHDWLGSDIAGSILD